MSAVASDLTARRRLRYQPAMHRVVALRTTTTTTRFGGPDGVVMR